MNDSTANKVGIIMAHLMKAAGLSERELSRKTGISKSVINRLIKDDEVNPTLDSLMTIANFFSISVGQLIGEIPLNTDDLGRYKTSVHDKNHIPVITWQEARNPQAYISNNKQSIFTECLAGKYTFALKINTVSMEPRFFQKSIVIVEPETNPNSGDFVIVAFYDREFAELKEIVFDGDEIFFITPGQVEVSQKLTKKDKIIGVVIQTIVNLVS